MLLSCFPLDWIESFLSVLSLLLAGTASPHVEPFYLDKGGELGVDTNGASLGYCRHDGSLFPSDQ